MSRDKAILAAASQLFYARGYDAVSVDEIGAAAGVTGPAIYRHFDGKEEILTTLFDSAMDRLLQLAGRPEDDPRAELDALIEAQIAFALDDRELLSIYAREDRSLTPQARRRLHRRERQYVDRWIGALERCHPESEEAELVVAAHAMIGLVLSVANWPESVLRTPGLRELLHALALDGARTFEGRTGPRGASSAAKDGTPSG
jgi:AcrR family transcriptional regulator